MSRVFKFVSFNGKYYLVDKQEGSRSIQKKFCDVEGHDFSRYDSPTIEYNTMEEGFGSDADDVHQTCNVCGFGVIYWRYSEEDMREELFQSRFREKYEEAEKSDKVVSWEYPPKCPRSSLLCSFLGHDYDYQQTHVNSQGNEIFLDTEESLDGVRLNDVRGWCSRCDYRCIEVYPNNKKFLKNKKGFN